ncbi:MAG: GAF domain-containing sensor histidine kinase [Patescibacteria group bacterium]
MRSFKTSSILILTAIVLVVGIFMTLSIGEKTDTEQREALQLRAEIAAKAIRSEDILNLSGTTADIDSPVYVNLKNIMQALKGVRPDIRFVYLMGYSGGEKLFFYIDSEDPRSPDYSTPGDIYEDTTPQELDGFKNGQAFVEGPLQDEWGTWVSAFAPVKDENGTTIALLGMDVNASLWNYVVFEKEIPPLLITAFLIILLLSYLYFAQRTDIYIQRIKKSEAIADIERNRLRSLYEIGNNQHESIAEQFRSALKVGNTTLETRMALINRIIGDEFTVLYVVAPSDSIDEGDRFSLKETYCDITVRKDDVVAISAMSISEYKAHACYSKFGLESYIGVPIKVNGELFGTLTFSAPDPHRPEFSESDKDFVRLMGAWVSATLERAEVDKMKSEFVSLASHQLNTPLSTINWFVDLLTTDEKEALSPEQKKYVTGIGEASTRMVDLVDALLNVSRIEMGTFAVAPVPVRLDEVAESLLSELDHQIKEKKLFVTKDFDPGIPPIPADPSLIRIVFQNLLTNAIKYNIDGGKLDIRIIQKPEYKDMVYCEIADTGLGVPKKDQSRIFQKLFRADNAKMKITDGNGLGLYIVKSIIESAGGKIWFASEENKGTIFSFVLPLSGMKARSGSKALVSGEKHEM